MSYEDRVELVEALLRNRALMLDPRGRPMLGISIFGIAPSDEEFQARAREIVDATGKDQRAAMSRIDAFEEEMTGKMEDVDRRLAELEKVVGVEDDPDDLPPPPPPLPG
jgi:hypothetical protein